MSEAMDHASIAGFQRVNIKVFPATYYLPELLLHSVTGDGHVTK